MKIDRFEELKQKLVKEKDFSEIWSFYMDYFADHPEFTDMGEPARNGFLEAAVPQICQQIFGRAMRIEDFLLIHIPEHQFFHGPFQADHRIGGLIYFEDIQVGMLAVSAEFPPTDLVKYSRFSGTRIPAPNRYEYN